MSIILHKAIWNSPSSRAILFYLAQRRRRAERDYQVARKTKDSEIQLLLWVEAKNAYLGAREIYTVMQNEQCKQCGRSCSPGDDLCDICWQEMLENMQEPRPLGGGPLPKDINDCEDKYDPKTT